MYSTNRVALAKASQTNTGLEIVHLLQVVHPAGIDYAQHNLAVELTHKVLAQALGLGVVALLNVRQHFGVEFVISTVSKLGSVHVARKLHNPLVQAFKVALSLMAIGGTELLHAAGHGVLDDIGDVVAKVLAVQNHVALGIDNLALLIHDVVVLKNVFTHGEVDILDLALGALHGLGHKLVLDRHVVGHICRDRSCWRCGPSCRRQTGA